MSFLSVFFDEDEAEADVACRFSEQQRNLCFLERNVGSLTVFIDSTIDDFVVSGSFVYAGAGGNSTLSTF